MDLKVGTYIDLQHISDNYEGHGHRSNVKVTKVQKWKNSSFQPSIRKYGSKSQRSRSKVVGQGQMSQKSRSKVVGQGQSRLGSFLLPIDLQEVRHGGVFISN